MHPETLPFFYSPAAPMYVPSFSVRAVDERVKRKRGGFENYSWQVDMLGSLTHTHTHTPPSQTSHQIPNGHCLQKTSLFMQPHHRPLSSPARSTPNLAQVLAFLVFMSTVILNSFWSCFSLYGLCVIYTVVLE